MTTTTFEKKIARLQIMLWCLTLVIAAILAWMLFIPAAGGTLRAEAIELVDDGRVVAVLESDNGYPRLVFRDGNGIERVQLFYDEEATGLYVSDGLGTTRVGVAQFAHGGGGVALHGEGSRGALVMYYKDSGSVSFFGQNGDVLREISARDLRGSK